MEQCSLTVHESGVSLKENKCHDAWTLLACLELEGAKSRCVGLAVLPYSAL